MFFVQVNGDIEQKKGASDAPPNLALEYTDECHLTLTQPLVRSGPTASVHHITNSCSEILSLSLNFSTSIVFISIQVVSTINNPAVTETALLSEKAADISLPRDAMECRQWALPSSMAQIGK